MAHEITPPRTLTVYGIANCDAVRRVRKALEDAGTAYDFVDWRRQPVASEVLAHWLGTLGGALVNPRSRSWSALAAETRADLLAGRSSDAALTALAEDPTRMRRPLLWHPDGRLELPTRSKPA